MRIGLLLVFLASQSATAWVAPFGHEPSDPHVEPTARSHFECKDLGANRFRPYYKQLIEGTSQFKDFSQTPKGLLGQNPMTSIEECEAALFDSNHEFGVICSRTGLGGWKPTLYTGTLPGRPDFGYLGGSTITNFGDCLTATKYSSHKGVCFWGGSEWYITPIDKEGFVSGPYRTIGQCVEQTKLNTD